MAIRKKHRTLSVRGKPTTGIFTARRGISSHTSVELAFERRLLMLSCGTSVIRIARAFSTKKKAIDEGLRIFEEAFTLAEKELR